MAATLTLGAPVRNYNAHSAPMSVWTVRIALFSAALIMVGVLGHRLFSMPTPIALNLFKAGFAGAGLTLLVGCGALYQIWRRGGRGAVTLTIGTLVALGIFAWPLAFVPSYRAFPKINDITTDITAPPRFVTLAKERRAGANNPAYPGVRFAKLQTEAYPDIKPFMIDRSAEETFDIVLQSLRRLKIKIIDEDAPKGRFGQPGFIEAIDRTTVIGFTDDIVIRIDGDGVQSRVDARSASRFGIHDFGCNAQRVRKILKEIQWQVEATIPSANGERVGRLRRGGRVIVPRRTKGAEAETPAARQAVPAKAEPKVVEPAKQPAKAKRRQEKFE